MHQQIRLLPVAFLFFCSCGENGGFGGVGDGQLYDGRYHLKAISPVVWTERSAVFDEPQSAVLVELDRDEKKLRLSVDGDTTDVDLPGGIESAQLCPPGNVEFVSLSGQTVTIEGHQLVDPILVSDCSSGEPNFKEAILQEDNSNETRFFIFVHESDLSCWWNSRASTLPDDMPDCGNPS